MIALIQLIFWIAVICIAVAYWQWAVVLVVLWIAFKIWMGKSNGGSQPAKSGRATGCYKPSGNTGNKNTDDNLKMGYRQFLSENDPDLLDLWPCQELIPVEAQKEVLNWPECWVQAGGKLYAGRMIARKDSAVWTSLSRFNLPYPPFDHNSGMGVRDVRRKEAEQLGVIKRSDVVKPHPA